MKEKILHYAEMTLGAGAFSLLFIGGSLAGSIAATVATLAAAAAMVGMIAVLEWIGDYYL